MTVFTRLFGWALMLVGALLMIYAVVGEIYIEWIEFPEATERLLWINHTWRMLGIVASGFGGLILAVLGYKVANS